MVQRAPDLAVLTRRPEMAAAEATDTRDSPTAIPPPAFKWKTRVLLPGVILAATVATLLFAAGDALRTTTPVRVVPVMVKSAADGETTGAVTVAAPGWVEADPFATAVSALADGVVEDVLVLEGQEVKTGQVVARLVEIDARLALDRAEAHLAQREAALRVAQAALDAAQRDWDNPIERTRALETADALLAEKRAELERWPAELAQAEAHAVYLQAEYDRLQPLHAAGQASDIELIQARQAHLAQQALVEATRARKAIIAAQIAALEAEVVAARENLRLRIPETRALDEARAAVQEVEASVVAARAARDEAALRLKRMEVRSPVDGIVMTRLVEPGSKLMLNADNPHSAQVVRVFDPQRLQVRVDIPLVDAAKVGVGQPAEIVVDVLPDQVFHGRLTRIVNEADVQKNTLQVKVAIEDPSPALKPEMLARARFLALNKATSGPAGDARLFVPERLVHRHGEGGGHVWLADQARMRASRRNVVLGRARLGDWIEIDNGLQPGDRLIVDPPSDLQDGARLRIVGEAGI